MLEYHITCMYACMHVSMDGWMYVCMNNTRHMVYVCVLCLFLTRMHVCMHVCIYV